MSVSVSRFGEITAVGTPTALTTDVAGATVNSQQPPPGATHIIGITASFPGDAAANGAAVAAVTLSGQGIKDTQDLVLGGIMVDGTPAAAAFVSR